MNIFILEDTIEGCAQSMCDKHVVKMMLEYVQLLSTTVHAIGEVGPYKATHQNHPCAVWARQSRQNYEWLWNLADATGIEYTFRYGKQHKSWLLMSNIPRTLLALPDKALTPFVNCTPYKDIPIIKAYRHYYNTDKAYFAKWKNGNVPEWFKAN